MPAGVRRPLGAVSGLGALGYGMGPESLGGLGGWGWTNVGYPISVTAENISQRKDMASLANEYQDAVRVRDEYIDELTEVAENRFTPEVLQYLKENPQVWDMMSKEYGIDFRTLFTGRYDGIDANTNSGSGLEALTSVGGGAVAGMIVNNFIYRQKVKRYAEEHGISEEQADKELGGPSNALSGLAGAGVGAYLNRDNIGNLLGSASAEQ